jgi:hypothetical protein
MHLDAPEVVDERKRLRSEVDDQMSMSASGVQPSSQPRVLFGRSKVAEQPWALTLCDQQIKTDIGKPHILRKTLTKNGTINSAF